MSKQSFYKKTGKRLFDVATATIGLLLLWPVLAVLALLVKFRSSGPILFRQDRVGRGGKVFRIAKFRSMDVDAEQRGLQITSAGDRRITPIGGILRRTKLDELPQLWNVLRGEMSLVGPRPEVPSYVQTYTTEQREVLSVRPGLTDPASILYREEEKLLAGQADPESYYREIVLPAKLKLNLEYLSRVSFVRDVFLILQTMTCVLTPKGTSTKDCSSAGLHRCAQTWPATPNCSP